MYVLGTVKEKLMLSELGGLWDCGRVEGGKEETEGRKGGRGE